MKKSMLVKTIWLAWTSAFLLAGCVYRERVVYREPGPPPAAEVVVTGAPPGPIVDVRMAAPGPGFVWIDGVYVWRGRWVWEAGHWGRPPRPGVVWVPHRYEFRGGRHVWIRGGWR